MTKTEGIKRLGTRVTASYPVDKIPKTVQDKAVATIKLNNGDGDQNEGGVVDYPVDRDVVELGQCDVEEAVFRTVRLELISRSGQGC